jgi:serine/threonine protein kinase
MENEIQNLINLRHPCIASPIGFVLPIESGSLQELKIVRLYSEHCSLAEVLVVRPVWWTSTVKAKAIAGIVLDLRFAHSLGLLHGHLTASNILSIHIIAFKLLTFIQSD